MGSTLRLCWRVSVKRSPSKRPSSDGFSTEGVEVRNQTAERLRADYDLSETVLPHSKREQTCSALASFLRYRLGTAGLRDRCGPRDVA